jgi:bicarbonate transport system ATP-binding protein
MHNLLLRYWLAAGGIDPDYDLEMKTIPPAQMVVDLQGGSIDGYCVGEPWNYRAAVENVGFTIATDLEVWLGHPGKVLGVREDWAENYPNTHIALTKALLEACKYCADPANALEVRQILARRDYVCTDLEYIQLEDPSNATCDLDHPLREFAHHQFYAESAINRPSRTEQIWIMTQLARWGDTPFPRNWVEVVERVCRVRVFSTAARELGLDINYTRQPIQLFDGQPFNADDPLSYLNELKIKRDFSVAEVILDTPRRTAA